MRLSRVDGIILVLTTNIGKEARREMHISAVALDAGRSLANSRLESCQL